MIIEQTSEQKARAYKDAGITLNASNIKDQQSYTQPTGNVDNPSKKIYDATANLPTSEQLKLKQAEQEQQRQDAIKQEQALQTENQGTLSKIKDFITGQPSRQTLLEQGRTKYQVPEQYQMITDMLPEVTTLRENLNALQAEEEQAVSSLENRGEGIPLGIIALQSDRVRRSYNLREAALSAQLGSKAATIEAIRGNLTLANTLIGQSVDAVMLDYTQKLQDYNNLYTYNKDLISSLDTTQKNILTKQIEDLQKEADTKRKTTETVGGMILKFNSLGAGILITDTLEEANRKASLVGGELALYGKQQQLQQQYGKTTMTTDGYKFTTIQENKGASNAGIGLNSFKSLQGEVQNFYINSSPTEIKAINERFNSIKSETDRGKIIEEINNSNLTNQVKAHLIQKANSFSIVSKSPTFANPFEKGVSGFFENVWGGVKDLFN